MIIFALKKKVYETIYININFNILKRKQPKKKSYL